MSSFPQKLYDFEAEPPVSGWNRISEALDDERSMYDFPAKLQGVEVAPPAAVWDRINSALAADEVSRPAFRTIPVFVRYAVAAAVIAAVAVAAFVFRGKPGSAEQLAVDEKPLISAPALKDSGTAQITADTRASATAPALATVAGSRRTLVSPARQVRTAVNADASQDEFENPLYAYDDHAAGIAERYIMLMTPDGGVIRMSKKLGDLVCCVAGEEQDAACKSQIRKWQEEIASSPAAGAGNVLDLLDLVNSLNNGTQL